MWPFHLIKRPGMKVIRGKTGNKASDVFSHSVFKTPNTSRLQNANQSVRTHKYASGVTHCFASKQPPFSYWLNHVNKQQMRNIGRLMSGRVMNILIVITRRSWAILWVIQWTYLIWKPVRHQVSDGWRSRDELSLPKRPDSAGKKQSCCQWHKLSSALFPVMAAVKTERR